MAKIAVIGTGYVGLTTGACFSHLGHDVVCADIDKAKVDALNRGEVPILEAGLDEIVREGLQSGRLRFVLGAATAVTDAEFAYLCVPTPQSADGSADLSYIEAAAREIAPHLEPETVVVNKSTVPVGSTRFVEQALGRSDVYVVSNPEFLREGSAVADFLKPDRVVIGSDHQNAAIRVASLYIGVPAPLMVTDPASAETIKYASNAFLATKLSFVNAIANLCEAVGADVNDVVLGMGYDKRIGQEFLRPGPGWGGSCFVGDETLLVRRGDIVRLQSFSAVADEVASLGVDGLEVLSWGFGDPAPEFVAVAALTRRPYEGAIVEVRTKMGRRLRVTADHPFVTSDGVDPDTFDVRRADELGVFDWLPVAQHAPLSVTDPPATLRVLDGLEGAGIAPSQVIVRVAPEGRAELEAAAHRLASHRRRDVLRCNAMRLDESRDLGIPESYLSCGTTTNGTYVPAHLPVDERWWFVLGLYLAEGHIGSDGDRERIAWSFHPTDEDHLAEVVADFWRRHGVKVASHRLTTTRQVSLSSRVLAAWFGHVLGVGRTCYDKRIPDVVWGLPLRAKQALLRGLWEGDGSWSLVDGGPSVVLEYGTASSALADGMLRLLGDCGIVARQKIGRTPKSTVDTHWLVISGADQVEEALFLFSDEEADEIRVAIEAQAKRIRPTGYRRLHKGAAWVRVTETIERPFAGDVFSVEIPETHTVVSTGGLVAHNCFPKDSRALLYIAKEAGYDFDLLEGVIAVNDEQFTRTADKVVHMSGGSVEGKTVGVWGLTFKANTDDRRESPALEIVRRLVERGARVQAYDPTVSGTLPELPEVVVCDDPYAAVEGADVLAVLTEWDELKWLDLDKVAAAMHAHRVVDARNLLDRSALLRRGFSYQGIGRA